MLWRKRAALERLPLFSQPLNLPLDEPQRVLVFAPHPDDETIGCGGTLARLSSRCDIRVVLVTDGAGAGGLPQGADLTRQEEFKRALQILGIADSVMLLQPDGAFAASDALLGTLREIITGFKPDWVLLPSPFDYHRDHLRISACLEPLCRNCPGIRRLLFYETWAPVPATHVVDITEQIGIKLDALSQHQTALAHGDYARAVEGLNRYRGIYLGHGRFAEAFWVESLTEASGLFGNVQGICLEMLHRLAQMKG